jgi:hypothetical protein
MKKNYTYSDLEKYELMGPTQKSKIVDGNGEWDVCPLCERFAKKVGYFQCFYCEKESKEIKETNRKAVL